MFVAAAFADTISIPSRSQAGLSCVPILARGVGVNGAAAAHTVEGLRAREGHPYSLSSSSLSLTLSTVSSTGLTGPSTLRSGERRRTCKPRRVRIRGRRRHRHNAIPRRRCCDVHALRLQPGAVRQRGTPVVLVEKRCTYAGSDAGMFDLHVLPSSLRHPHQ